MGDWIDAGDCYIPNPIFDIHLSNTIFSDSISLCSELIYFDMEIRTKFILLLDLDLVPIDTLGILALNNI